MALADMGHGDAERAQLLQVLVDVFDWRVRRAAAHLTRPDAYFNNRGELIPSWEWDGICAVKTSVQHEMVRVNPFLAALPLSGYARRLTALQELAMLAVGLCRSRGYPCRVPETLHAVYRYFYEAELGWEDIPVIAARAGSTENTTPALHLPTWWTWIRDSHGYNVRIGFTQVINMALGEVSPCSVDGPPMSDGRVGAPPGSQGGLDSLAGGAIRAARPSGHTRRRDFGEHRP